MACTLTKGRQRACKESIGGTSKLYLFDYLEDAFTISAGEATAMNVALTAAWTYDLVGDASTFTEETCKGLIGQKIPGSIQRIPSDPYEFTVPSTGEILVLDHRWVYMKEGETIDEVVREEELVESKEEEVAESQEA